MGIFIDEIGFILTRGEDNYSPKSFIIIMSFILILFIAEENIIDFYLNF